MLLSAFVQRPTEAYDGLLLQLAVEQIEPPIDGGVRGGVGVVVARCHLIRTARRDGRARCSSCQPFCTTPLNIRSVRESASICSRVISSFSPGA